MEQELKNWVKTFYSGSNRAGQVELKAFNEKYSLCYLKGETGYTTRMGGNVYSPSQWFVCENLSTIDKMWRHPKFLFSVDGRLTKEHKEEILIRFNLEIPKQERKKSVKPVDKWLIAIEQGAFWGGSFSSNVYYQRIVKEDENKFITYSVGADKNVTFNKNKYNCLVVDIDDLQGTLVNIKNLIEDYKRLSGELSNRKNEILSWFGK